MDESPSGGGNESVGAGGARDDLAYFLPMLAFMAGTAVGPDWPRIYVAAYIVKTLAAGALLIALRKHFTRIRWDFWWIGLIVGVIGIFQWVGMEKGLLRLWPGYPRMGGTGFDPFAGIHSTAVLWTFLAVRLVGPVLVVPFMEELFWRDFLWRTIIAPNDFKLAEVGERDWKAFLWVTLLFASVHNQWATALVWGAMIAILLMRTKSLGACIVAHATTNLLLGVYVVITHDWQFW